MERRDRYVVSPASVAAHSDRPWSGRATWVSPDQICGAARHRQGARLCSPNNPSLALRGHDLGHMYYSRDGPSCLQQPATASEADTNLTDAEYIFLSANQHLPDFPGFDGECVDFDSFEWDLLDTPYALSTAQQAPPHFDQASTSDRSLYMSEVSSWIPSTYSSGVGPDKRSETVLPASKRGRFVDEAAKTSRHPSRCRLCDGTFSRAADLLRHLEQVHGRSKTYKTKKKYHGCGFCALSFSNAAVWARHVHECCAGSQSHSWSMDSQIAAILRHDDNIKATQLAIRPQAWNTGLDARQLQSLKANVLAGLELGITALISEAVRLLLTSFRLQLREKVSVSLRSDESRVVQAKYDATSDLAMLTASGTDIRSRPRRCSKRQDGFQCAYCEKLFDRATDRRKHELRSHCEATFPCDVCARSFHFAKDLRRHIASKMHQSRIGNNSAHQARLHCPVAACKYADEGFARADHLTRHLSRAHKDFASSMEDCEAPETSGTRSPASEASSATSANTHNASLAPASCAKVQYAGGPEKDNEYTYEPLGEQQMRLLVIHPGRRDQAVEGHLIKVRLGEAKAVYDALSYTWGPATKSHALLLAGQPFHINKTQAELLKHLRSQQAATTMWVDSICINHRDAAERGKQVSMMSQIFGGAARTLVWLENSMHVVAGGHDDEQGQCNGSSDDEGMRYQEAIDGQAETASTPTRDLTPDVDFTDWCLIDV